MLSLVQLHVTSVVLEGRKCGPWKFLNLVLRLESELCVKLIVSNRVFRMVRYSRTGNFRWLFSFHLATVFFCAMLSLVCQITEDVFCTIQISGLVATLKMLNCCMIRWLYLFSILHSRFRLSRDERLISSLLHLFIPICTMLHVAYNVTRLYNMASSVQQMLLCSFCMCCCLVFGDRNVHFCRYIMQCEKSIKWLTETTD